MALHKEAEAYLDRVCGQVRWKKAHGCIRQELGAHIEDQAAQYRKEGLEEAEAWAKAVASMGDPVEAGALFDASYRPAPGWPTLLLLTGLVLAGLLAQGLLLGTAPQGRALLGVLLAVVGFIGFYLADWRQLKGAAPVAWGVLLAIALGVLGRAPALGTLCWNAMLLFPMVYGFLLWRLWGQGWKGLLLAGLAYGLPLGALVYRNEYSMALLLLSPGLGAATLALLLGCFQVDKKKGLLLLWGGVLGVGGLLAAQLPAHAKQRLQVLFQPSLDPMGGGFLPLLQRELLSGAKLLGPGSLSGPMASAIGLERALEMVRQETPLCYLIHQYGWWVLILLLLGVGYLLYRLFRGVRQQGALLGKLLGYPILLLLVAQYAMALCGNLGLYPYATPALPFLSQGNASLGINGCLMGLLLSVTDTGRVQGSALLQANVQAAKHPDAAF